MHRSASKTYVSVVPRLIFHLSADKKPAKEKSNKQAYRYFHRHNTECALKHTLCTNKKATVTFINREVTAIKNKCVAGSNKMRDGNELGY